MSYIFISAAERGAMADQCAGAGAASGAGSELSPDRQWPLGRAVMAQLDAGVLYRRAGGCGRGAFIQGPPGPAQPRRAGESRPAACACACACVSSSW